jgi:acyl homoserine lactone synthase
MSFRGNSKEGSMKIMALKTPASAEEAGILDEMHCLRARVFGGRLGWNVTIANGREADEFDLLGPTYILALTAASQVVGCARLLPATGPTMLCEVFPQLIGGQGLQAHSGMVESSRFCVDTGLDGSRGGLFRDATLAMLAGIVEWCIHEGFTEIVTATDVTLERVLRRAGWSLRRVGEPVMIADTLSVAGILPANREVLERLKPDGYRSKLESPYSIA